MIKININKKVTCPVSSVKIKIFLSDFFKKNGIVSDAEVNVSIVGKEKMISLAKKYLNENGVLHNVLSFTTDEAVGLFTFPPDNIIHLGDIIICYPKVFEEAKNEGLRIEDKMIGLIEHGAWHLLGKHHG